jgi:uncharacterized protein YraI
MKRLCLLLVIVLLGSMTISAVYADAPAQDGGLLARVTTRSNLRAGPGTQWKKVATLSVGDTLLLDGRDPTGLWVRGITSGGVVGWSAARFLSITQDQAFALPSIWVDTPFTLGAPPAGIAPQTAPPAAAAEPPSAPLVEVVAPPEGGLAARITNRVNVRQEPSTNAPVLAKFNAGATVTIDGRDGGGLWVRATGSGVSGWVAARFTSLDLGQVASLPVVQGGGGLLSPAAPPAQEPGAPPPVVNTAPVSGFSYGGHVAALSSGTVNAMRRAGMSWVKKQWRYFAGQDPAGVAGMVQEAHANGFRILIGIVGVNYEVNNPGYFDQYAAFVAGAAAQGVDAIEVWNEMNIDREWPAGSIDPGRYTQLLQKAYSGIKGANPNTLVISGAPSPTGYFGGCSANGCDDAPFIRGMAAAGAANYADCIGLHYNEGIVGPTQTSGDPRGNSGFYTRYFWGMVNTYSAAFGGARPLCFTELGYLTGQGFPPLPGGFAWAQNVTVADQASWLDQAVSLAGSSGKVRLLIVWNIDFRQYDADPMAGYAIIRPDGSCPACEALGS